MSVFSFWTSIPAHTLAPLALSLLVSTPGCGDAGPTYIIDGQDAGTAGGADAGGSGGTSTTQGGEAGEASGSGGNTGGSGGAGGGGAGGSAGAPARAIGAPCANDSECASGVCIPETDEVGPTGWTDGYCISGCSTHTDCLPNGVCVEVGENVNGCLASCANSTCRTGYVCVQEGEIAACVPNCNEPGAGCAEGAVCREDGRCEIDSGGCFPGDYRIVNSADFAGLQAYTCVTGNLEIWGDDALTDISALAHLTAVGGTLDVMLCDELTSLEGLHGISAVGGDVDISMNDKLTNLEGLRGLSSVGGSVDVSFNDGLATLQGLNITSIQGDLSISSNGSMTWHGLESLATVSGSVYLRGTTPNLQGLNSLASVGSDIAIYGTLSLVGLDNLTSVGGELAVGDDLQNFEGLVALQSLGGLSITDTTTLTNLTGFPNIPTFTGDLLIRDNQALTNLDGLQGLSSVMGDVMIGECCDAVAPLQTLTGLDNLTTVGGQLRISWNLDLTSITALSNLTSVGGDLEFLRNPLLPQAQACTVLGQLVDFTGYALVTDNQGGSECLQCQPGETHCDGINQQSCGQSGYFVTDEVCPSACVGGSCVQGVCDYGQSQCLGGNLEVCSTEGAWVLDPCFRETCTNGACAFPSCASLANCCWDLSGTDATICQNVSANGSNSGCASTLESFRDLGAC